MSGGAVLAEAYGEQSQHKEQRKKPSGRRKAIPYLLLLPGIAWLAVFFIAPMISLLQNSLQSGDLINGFNFTWQFSNYTDALSQYWPQFVRSFVYAGLATVFCIAIGYPLAYTIAFKAGRFKNAMLVLVIAPFFTSFLIRTLAWQTILADNGIVVSVMRDLHITNLLALVHLTETNRVLNTPLAVVAGLTYNFLPFMTLPLYAALDRMDGRLIEAAQDLYASAWTSFRKITWPISLPGVVAGTLLTFIPAAGDYINSRLLGVPNQAMIGEVIDLKYFTELNYPTASALSFTLLIAILILVMLYVRQAGTEELV